MTGTMKLSSVEVELEKREDGSRIIRNKVPLAPCPDNLCSWLHRNAEEFPQKPFLMQRNPDGEWQGLSYGEARHQVNRLSNGLVARALDPERPLALLSENCINMALFKLACMQVGFSVTPISYAYSAISKTGSHIKHILDVTGSPLLIMSDADLHMNKLNQWELGKLQMFAFSNSEQHSNVMDFESLLEDDTELTMEAQTQFDAVTPDTVAKIQFTSGSTNLPKGVIVTHGMMVTNQVGIHQMWPFMDSNEVIIDWLPWNHTFGGNFVFNMMLKHGGTFYIDHGNPTPIGLKKTIENIRDISPSIYFGVPRSYTALYAKMKVDEQLKKAFFKNLKFIFTAAAALDQSTYKGMQQMSKEVLGNPLPFFSGWGTTETSPDATLVYWKVDEARVIGLPIPGVEVKLTPDPSGKTELRVKGPNITPGYFNQPEATAAAFDEEGFYLTQDGGRFLDPDQPEAGLVFDGRTSENFKLASGTWVHNSGLRSSINALGQPYLLEVVVAAPDRDYLTAMVFPNLPGLRGKFPQVSEAHPNDPDFLQCPEVVGFFHKVFQEHNSKHQESSARFERFSLLQEPPRIDRNETTDKGYINQLAVLNHRAGIVESLYAFSIPPGVIVVDAEN